MKTKKVSPINYAFAIGKIRALERFLIKQEVFQEAMESSLNEALRLFVEANLYSEELLHIKDSHGLETVLNQELLKLKQLIRGLILDKELFRLLEWDDFKKIQDIVTAYGSAFLIEYLRYFIDMHNIKTFLRLYVIKEAEEKLKMNLVSGGFIAPADFLKFYNQEITVLLSRLEYVHQDARIVDYASFLGEAIKKVTTDNSFVALEKSINDFLIQVLKPAKYLSFGPEALLAYYFAKRNEINLLRMIILSKFNNVSEDLVKERLNAVYA